MLRCFVCAGQRCTVDPDDPELALLGFDVESCATGKAFYGTVIIVICLVQVHLVPAGKAVDFHLTASCFPQISRGFARPATTGTLPSSRVLPPRSKSAPR